MSPNPKSRYAGLPCLDGRIYLNILENNCGGCGSRQYGAHLCVQCDKPVCKKCFPNHVRAENKKPGQNKEHTMIRVKEYTRKQFFQPRRMTTKCAHHHQPSMLVCLCCETYICNRYCFPNHTEHNLQYILHGTIEGQGRLNNYLVCNMNRIDGAMKRITKRTQEIRENYENEKLKIQSAYIYLRAIMDARFGRLYEELDKVCVAKTAKLMKQLERYGDFFETLTKCNDLMVYEGNVAPQPRPMYTTADELTSWCPVPALEAIDLEPCITSSMQLMYDCRSFIGAMQRFGAIQSDVPTAGQLILGAHSPVFHTEMSIAESIYLHPPTIHCSLGEKEEDLKCPYGICVTKDGYIIIADRGNNCIKTFDDKMRLISEFGQYGNKIGQLSRPAGICINPYNQIVVGDKDNHRVQIFKMDGSFVLTFGEKGESIGQLYYPWDVACNNKGEILVSDTRNHRVQLFTAAGAFLAKFDNKNVFGPKTWDSPRGVCFTPSGQVLVSDFNTHRVFMFDDENFNNPRMYGQEHEVIEGCFSRPQSIVCDIYGNIIIADTKNNRVQLFDRNMNFLYALGTKKSNQFVRPNGVALTPKGALLVTDNLSRVQIFQPKPLKEPRQDSKQHSATYGFLKTINF